MKIISYNIRCGRMFDNLKDFLAEHAWDTDVFCFQEVFSTNTDVKIVDEYYRANLLWEICALLPDHQAYYAPAQAWRGFWWPVDYHQEFGIAIFVKKSIKVIDSWVKFIFGSYSTKWESAANMPRNIQYMTLEIDGIQTHVAHFHWLWTWWGKDDTDKRIKQSFSVNKVLEPYDKRLVLMWDFNLNPDTTSLEMLVKWRRNLIKEYEIPTTRSKLYTKPLKFADYAIITTDIHVRDFSVPYSEASDHLPLILEID